MTRFGQDANIPFDKCEGNDFEELHNGAGNANWIKPEKVSDHFMDVASEGPVARLERELTETERNFIDVVVDLDLSDIEGQKLAEYTNKRVLYVLGQLGWSEEEIAGVGKKYLKLPNVKALRRKAVKLTDLSIDGNLESHTFTVPEKFIEVVKANKDLPANLDLEEHTTVELQLKNPVSAVVEVLTDPSVACAGNYQFDPQPYTGKYQDITSGNWFRDAVRRSAVQEQGAQLLAIGFSTDSATVDRGQRVSVKPINVVALNMTSNVSQTSRGKRCFGYWPKLNILKFIRSAVRHAELQRMFNQWVIAKIVEGVNKYKFGIRLRTLDGVTRTLIPAIAFVATDWPEGQLHLNLKANATQSRMNCRMCTRPTTTFSATEEGASFPRRLQADAQAFSLQYHGSAWKGTIEAREKAEMARSMFSYPCSWWAAPTFSNKFGVYSMFPFDTLHTVSSGLISTLKDILIARTSTAGMNTFEFRLQTIKRVRDPQMRRLYYKPFMEGITVHGRWSGDDYIALLQQMPFAVGYGSSVIEDPRHRKTFLQLCACIRAVLLVLKMKCTGEDDLAVLHRNAKRIGPLLVKASAKLGNVPTTDRPKVHALVHFRYQIRRFGAAVTTDTGTFETLQKEVSHATFRRDCNRVAGREARLLTSVHLRTSLRTVCEKEISDPPIREQALHFSFRRANSLQEELGALSEVYRVRMGLEAVVTKADSLQSEARAVLDMTVYGKLQHDFGQVTTVYVASPNYLRTGPRNDFVMVQWEGIGDPAPAKLLVLFGDSTTQKKAEGADEEPMYALVQDMTPCLPGRIGYPAYELNGDSVASSFQVVHVTTIVGHARLIPDFDERAAVPRTYWLDDLRKYVVWDSPIVGCRLNIRMTPCFFRRGGTLSFNGTPASPRPGQCSSWKEEKRRGCFLNIRCVELAK
jgi:hypothetical protein